MIDHVGFAVSDLRASRRFYEAALAPLGLSVIMEVNPQEHGSKGNAIGFGKEEIRSSGLGTMSGLARALTSPLPWKAVSWSTHSTPPL